MNLGDVYVKTFLLLLLAPALAAIVLMGLFRRRLQLTWGAVISVTLLVPPIAGVLLNYSFHRSLFVAWHKMQNQFVPPTGCLTYSPDFSRLYATYQMTLPQFNAWSAAHPWGLSAGSNSLLSQDTQAMGFDSPQSSMETSTADNGKQLRVYFKSGIMYLSYNSM